MIRSCAAFFVSSVQLTKKMWWSSKRTCQTALATSIATMGLAVPSVGAADMLPGAIAGVNEEISNLLKRKIKGSLSRLDELGIAFEYEGEVAESDAQQILDKVKALHARALAIADGIASGKRAESLRVFAANLHKVFYGFEPDFFQHNLLLIVDDFVSVIKGSIELWPTLIEICYFQKGRKGLPITRVANRRK